MTFDGMALHDQTVPAQIPALSSQVYLKAQPRQWLPAGTNPANVFIAADLTVDGRSVSRNLIYLQPTKQVRLPVATVTAEVRADGDAYRVRLASKVLARSVYLSFGALDVELSDNYFDLLPGEAVDLRIKSSASLDNLRKNLTIRSLVDAFPPNS
jgi:beta-mannosidase